MQALLELTSISAQTKNYDHYIDDFFQKLILRPLEENKHLEIKLKHTQISVPLKSPIWSSLQSPQLLAQCLRKIIDNAIRHNPFNSE